MAKRDAAYARDMGGGKEPSILAERNGAVLVVTLNRPAVMNALDSAMLAELGSVILELEEDQNLRVGILTGGGGRAFSAGGDLKEMAHRPLEDGAFVAPRLGQMPGFDELASCSKPMIAAIDGYCLGGGFELALSCDIRVATEQSKFGLPEPRHGFLAGPALHHLSRMIPLGEALGLHLTGTPIEATRAFQIGLIQELTETRDGMFRAAFSLAERIASCSETAVRMIKHIVLTGRNLPVEYSWALAAPYQDAVASGTDARKGTGSFVAKRSQQRSDKKDPS